MNSLFARLAATISELKANPNEVLRQSNGEPIVILSHNKPKAYMVPVETYEQMQEQLEDYRLLQEARKRLDDESVPVTIDELRAAIQQESHEGMEKA
ncbi:type II toxin-antitoxin system Phd/YefM family antitoxin [Marinobacter mangrovi]|uniref:type II toxin-antitoxin system Phd/YefM family antitoxin n=1 Tax=Marinobacter mangrovi TaxID=2803918 RepID=UPI001931B3FA|nr:type II toxin-antitoxin system Phd/YefM family antitoxin [Marinobacter mangrovi]